MTVKLPVIFLLFSLVVNSCAHRKSIVVNNDEKVIGRNLIDNKDLEVVEHQFPERIYNHNYDTISGFLTIQLRGVSRRGRYLKRGNIIQYDPKNKEGKWVKKIDYRSTELQQFNDLIIEKSGYKSRRLDVNTGFRTRLNSLKSLILFWDRHKMLLVYPSNA